MVLCRRGSCVVVSQIRNQVSEVDDDDDDEDDKRWDVCIYTNGRTTTIKPSDGYDVNCMTMMNVGGVWLASNKYFITLKFVNKNKEQKSIN